MDRQKLDKQRADRLKLAEHRAGIKEGHYMLTGQFVNVWVSFYPKTQWWIADAQPPRGENIEGTARKLDDETKAKLESWL